MWCIVVLWCFWYDGSILLYPVSSQHILWSQHNTILHTYLNCSSYNVCNNRHLKTFHHNWLSAVLIIEVSLYGDDRFVCVSIFCMYQCTSAYHPTGSRLLKVQYFIYVYVCNGVTVLLHICMHAIFKLESFGTKIKYAFDW